MMLDEETLNELSVRAADVLERLGVKAPRDLERFTITDLWRTRGCGRKTAREIATWAMTHRVYLAPETVVNCEGCKRTQRELSQLRAACTAMETAIKAIRDWTKQTKKPDG